MFGFEIGQFTAITRCEPVISFAFFSLHSSVEAPRTPGAQPPTSRRVAGTRQSTSRPSKRCGWNADRGVGWPEEFQRKDRRDEPPADDPGSPTVDFHGEKRSNETHDSTTDPDARLARKSGGHEAKLSYCGNVLIENRNGLVVDNPATANTIVNSLILNRVSFSFVARNFSENSGLAAT
jgi:hypothetical protein